MKTRGKWKGKAYSVASFQTVSFGLRSEPEGMAACFTFYSFLFPAPCGFRDFAKVLKSNDICKDKSQFICSQSEPVCSVCKAERGAPL